MKIAMGFAAAAVAFLPFATNALAVQVDIDTVTGVWTDVSGGDNVAMNGNTLSWGTPLGSDGQSSYVFDGTAPTGPHDAGEIFDIGMFTHNNYTIGNGTSIDGATLEVTTTGTIYDTASGSSKTFELTSIFDFDHNETTNNPRGNCNFGGNKPCPDLVTAFNDILGSETLTLDGMDYLLAITGFEDGTTFLTKEGDANSTSLQATFISKASVVPLPAGLPLLVSALGLVGFAARRRRRAA